MCIVLPMYAETIFCLTIFVADWTVVHTTIVMHLKVLLHVSNVNCHFVAQQTLHTLDASQLPGILRHIIVEFNLVLVT